MFSLGNHLVCHVNTSFEALVKNVVDKHVVFIKFLLIQGQFKGPCGKGHIHPEEESSCFRNIKSLDETELS